jgi:hypothetical protein
MMMQCPKYKGQTLLKMYPTMTKSEAKDFMQLGEKSMKTSQNKLKCPHDVLLEKDNKKATLTSQQEVRKSMPPSKSLPPKGKEVYELNSDEDFSST